jgi:hypothetical protein
MDNQPANNHINTNPLPTHFATNPTLMPTNTNQLPPRFAINMALVPPNIRPLPPNTYGKSYKPP